MTECLSNINECVTIFTSILTYSNLTAYGGAVWCSQRGQEGHSDAPVSEGKQQDRGALHKEVSRGTGALTSVEQRQLLSPRAPVPGTLTQCWGREPVM